MGLMLTVPLEGRARVRSFGVVVYVTSGTAPTPPAPFPARRWSFSTARPRGWPAGGDHRVPDATGVGWVYQYAADVEQTESFGHACHPGLEPALLALAKAEGVAEVASVGGFVRQYNVVVDPQRMRDLGITMPKMRDAIRASNADVGGRTVGFGIRICHSRQGLSEGTTTRQWAQGQ